jgi:hypothetical protein
MSLASVVQYLWSSWRSLPNIPDVFKPLEQQEIQQWNWSYEHSDFAIITLSIVNAIDRISDTRHYEHYQD